LEDEIMATYNRKSVVQEAVTVPTRVTGDKGAKPDLEAAAKKLAEKIAPMLNTVAESKQALIDKQSSKTLAEKTAPVASIRHGGR